MVRVQKKLNYFSDCLFGKRKLVARTPLKSPWMFLDRKKNLIGPRLFRERQDAHSFVTTLVSLPR